MEEPSESTSDKSKDKDEKTKPVVKEFKHVKPAKAVSLLWEFYSLEVTQLPPAADKKQYVTCMLCLKPVSYHGSTSVLRDHLSASRSPIDHRNAIAWINEREAKAEGAAQSPVKKRKQLTLDEQTESHFRSPLSPDRIHQINVKIANLIAAAFLPISIVNLAEFRELISELEPRFSLLHRKQFTNKVIFDRHKVLKSNLGAALQEISCAAFTTDGWTSLNTEHYICLTIHWIDSQWKLRKGNLATIKLDVQTAEEMAKVILSTLIEWKLDNLRLRSLTTDNASVMVALAKREELKINYPIPCGAHTLQLVLKPVLLREEVTQLTTKVRLIVSHFHRSTIATSKLLEVQCQAGVTKPLKLKLDVVTRWNSTYDMLFRFINNFDFLSKAITSNEIYEVYSSLLPKKGLLVDLCTLLKPFYQATKVLSADTAYPSLSLLFPTLLKLSEDIREFSPISPYNGLFLELKRDIFSEISSRFHDRDLKASHIATLLNPAYKDFKYDPQKDNEYWQEIKELLKMLQIELERQKAACVPKDEVLASGSGPIPTSEEQLNPEDLVQQRIAALKANQPWMRKRTQQTFADPEQEIFAYQALPLMPTHVGNNPQDPLLWWKNQAVAFPLLSELARFFLAIPATSVPSERIWSDGGQLVTTLRSRLNPEHIDQLLSLHVNKEFS